jgi:hypothetical protein
MGASLLTALGFRDLIARTPQDYVDIAVRASRDGRALAQLKARLARRVQVAPFFDTSMWVHDYEALLFGETPTLKPQSLIHPEAKILVDYHEALLFDTHTPPNP